jgi:hypothetical protein
MKKTQAIGLPLSNQEKRNIKGGDDWSLDSCIRMGMRCDYDENGNLLPTFPRCMQYCVL